MAAITPGACRRIAQATQVAFAAQEPKPLTATALGNPRVRGSVW